MTEDLWIPGPDCTRDSNLAGLMRTLGAADYDAFLALSVDRLEDYWAATLDHLQVRFDPPATAFLDVSEGLPWARFFPGAGFNYAAACLRTPDGAADRLAVSWEDEAGRSGALSYAELSDRTRRFASGLLKAGVQPGDRVGFLFPNIPEAIVSLLALGYIGAIAVPLYTGYGAEAIERRLVDAGATALVTAHGFTRRGRIISLARLAAAVKARVAALRTLIIVDDPEQSDFPAEALRWRDVEANGDPGLEPHPTAANDPFLILYTSGTSGKPKGAVHVHAGFPLRVAQDVAFLFDFKPGDRYFWMSDMGWMVGAFSICSVLLNKGTLVLYEGSPDVPDIGRLRAVATRHDVTHFGSSPTAVRMMAGDENAALAMTPPNLRVLMTGGEVMDAPAHTWFFQRFGQGRLPIINYTGGTEVSGAILTNVVLRPIAPSRFNSTAPGVRGVVIAADGQVLTQTPGELAIAEPWVGKTQGFWNDNERYLETYWSQVPGFWVHGDLAVKEADGQYLLLGRSDDVMKVSGRRVGPSEIEAIVAEDDRISDVAVFGVPDSRSGEAMVVLAVPTDADTGTDLGAEIAARIKRKMGPAFSPRAVVLIRRLAKTRNGKMIRRLARQAWLDETPGDLTAVEDPAVYPEMAETCRLFREIKIPAV